MDPTVQSTMFHEVYNVWPTYGPTITITISPTTSSGPSSYPTTTSSPTSTQEAIAKRNQRRKEHDVLRLLYEATGGDNWERSTGWLDENILHCEWEGVRCSEEGFVDYLELYSNSLTGTVPTELGRLEQLRELILYDNSLTGTVPTELGRLEQLGYLYLYDNSLTGTVPTELGRLEQLRALHLNENSLTGTIPTELGGMVELNGLLLSDNSLTGTIPTELGGLMWLQYLNLRDNSLSGSIPTALGGVAQLDDLLLSNNSLTGNIPSELGKLNMIKNLDLHSNSFNGTIPTEVGNLKGVNLFDLSGNMLTGKIPTEIGELVTLNSLPLHENKLTGAVPSELRNIAGLEYLNMSHNKLSSFDFSGEWALKICDLSNNKIQQQLPSDVSGLSTITELLLSRNFISGTIPNGIRSLIRMERLHLDNNALHGTIPDDLTSMSRLRELRLSHNVGRVVGNNCEPYYWQYKEGDTVCCDVAGVQICSERFSVERDEFYFSIGLHGPIPAGFGNTRYLAVMELSDNLLTGTVPPELGSLPRIDVLDLSNNNLNGSIPSELGALKEANSTVRLIGNADIVGRYRNKVAPLRLCNIPGFDLASDRTWCPQERNFLNEFYISAKGQEWTNNTGWDDEYNDHCDWHGIHCTNKSVVDILLGNNGLSGRISSSIAGLGSLEQLYLEDNDLRGRIPEEIENLTELSSVRLNYNALTGIIPKGLAHLLSLKLLHLHGNRLTGTAPSLTFEKKNKSSFISDCGSPSDFDDPLKCLDCTMCCNSQGGCYPTQDNKGTILSPTPLTLVVTSCAVAFFALVAAMSFFFKAFKSTSLFLWGRIIGNDRVIPPGCAGIAAGNEKSVYSFLLGDSLVGWLISLVTLALQVFILSIFIQASRIDPSDDSNDFTYSWRCPRNSIDCKFDSDIGPQGWVAFSLIISSYLMTDLVNGLKLLGIFTMMDDAPLKRCQCFFSGLFLFLITFLTLYTSIMYNMVIATSDTELVINAVVILFIMDLDEYFYSVLEANGSKWLDDINSFVKSFPAQPLSVTVDDVAPVEEATPLEDTVWEGAMIVEEVTPVDVRVDYLARITMAIGRNDIF